jgi:hypothetical protein
VVTVNCPDGEVANVFEIRRLAKKQDIIRPKVLSAPKAWRLTPYFALG